MHVDDSACNLASLNLMKFRRADGTFDVERFEHAVDIVLLAQEIVVGPSSYPTEEIGDNARAFRQLGLGYANLGAFLMSNGMPYDSDAGRGTAAAITALMTGRAYLQSAQGRRGDRPVRALRRRTASRTTTSCACTATRRTRSRTRTCADDRAARGRARVVGRGGRSSASARLPQRAGDGARADRDDLVPHGLRHDRHRARLLARQVQGARRRRHDDDRQPHGAAGAADARLRRRSRSSRSRRHINEHGTIVGAPGLADEHLPVFDVAVGERAISHMGHIKMMGAVQPFISGAISKTVNMPDDGDGRGHRRRLHPGVAARRQGAGDLPRRLEDRAGAAHRRAGRSRAEAASGVARRRSTRSSPSAVEAADRRAPRSARSAGGCRASASRSRTSSRSAATRATSPPACTRTARSARSS